MNVSKKNHKYQSNNIILVSKKLMVTCILAISFITASASQLFEVSILTDTISKEETKTTATVVNPVVPVEEVDEPFDFNTKDYLPVGFNAYLTLDREYDMDFSPVVEEDEPFDFNTKDYLPIGFSLSRTIIDSIVEISIEEKDEPFDFDTAQYLPKGFNAYKENEIVSEL